MPKSESEVVAAYRKQIRQSDDGALRLERLKFDSMIAQCPCKASPADCEGCQQRKLYLSIVTAEIDRREKTS